VVFSYRNLTNRGFYAGIKQVFNFLFINDESGMTKAW